MPAITLYETDGVTALAKLDQIETLTLGRKLRRPGTFKLSVSTNTARYRMLTKGRYIAVSDVPGPGIARVHRIDQIERSVESDSVIVTGQDYSGIFNSRLVVPLAGQGYWSYAATKTETIVKGLVSGHAGPAAAAARRVPNMTIEADSARGVNTTIQGRYQTLSDLLEEVLTFGGAGYEMVFTGATYDFRYVPGTDRSASVFLTLDAESVTDQSWLQTDVNRKSMLYVAGQGDLDLRLIVQRHQGGVEKTGLDRLEALVDARDLTSAQALSERGDIILAGMQTDNRYNAVLYQGGSYKYGIDFFLGDIVTVRNNVWGLSQAVRVVSATMEWTPESEQPSVSVELDRPWPTIADRITQEAFGLSTVPASGAVDYHPQIHASSHYPAGNDPLSLSSLGAVAKAGDAMTGGLTAPTILWGPTLLRVEAATSFNGALPSGWYLVSSPNTGAPTADAGNWYLHHIRHNDSNNNYALQQAWHQNDPGKCYVRTINNDVPATWYRMWTALNDGSGSGLDADLVRGYVPVNKAGDSMSGSLLVANRVGVYQGDYQGIDFYSTGSMDMRANDPYFFWRSQSQDRCMQMLMGGGVVAFRGLNYAVSVDYGTPWRFHMLAGNNAIYTDSNGYTGFGLASPTYRVQTPNTADAGGAVLANAHPTYSSIEDKANVAELPPDVPTILDGLRGVLYEHVTAPGVMQAGMIAEEVAPIFPQAVVYYPVVENQEPVLDPETGEQARDVFGELVWVEGSGTTRQKPALNYNAFIPLLLEGVKRFRTTWQARIVTEQAAYDNLSAQIDALQAAVPLGDARLDALTAAGAALGTRLTALETAAPILSARVTALDTNTTAYFTWLAARVRVLELRAVPVITPPAPPAKV